MGAHCSYSLLKYGQFDEEGNAKRYKLNIQTSFIKAMKTVVDGIVGAVDLLLEHGNEKVSELLGSIVATAFCCERETNKVDEWQEIKDSALSVYSYAKERFGSCSGQPEALAAEGVPKCRFCDAARLFAKQNFK